MIESVSLLFGLSLTAMGLYGLIKGSRERILREIESRLEQYQLRSISEAKELESGE
jgi:hypothetical protein